MHRALTGRSNRRILANLRRLASAGAEVVVRVPVIPGQNDQDHHISLLVDWLARHKSLREVHLMPYHRLASTKYENLGLPYAMRDVDVVPDAVLDSYRAALLRRCLTVRVGG
jgi:pyruvate formate lyase activating enzyme